MLKQANADAYLEWELVGKVVENIQNNNGLNAAKKNELIQPIKDAIKQDIYAQANNFLISTANSKNLDQAILDKKIIELTNAMDNLGSQKEKNAFLKEFLKNCDYIIDNAQLSAFMAKFAIRNQATLVAMTASNTNQDSAIASLTAAQTNTPSPAESAALGIKCIHFVTPGKTPQRLIISLAN